MVVRTRIIGGVVIPVTESGLWYENGHVVVEDGRIVAVGPGEGPPVPGEAVVNAAGKYVLPGFVNAHGHAAMALLRGYADDLPLMDWLQKKVWPIEDRLTGEDIYWGTMLALLEMIEGGITTFADMYFHMDRVAEAVAQAGVRGVLSRGIIGTGPDEGRGAIRESREFASRWHGAEGGRITVTLGPHAPYTCPPAVLRQVAEVSAELGVGIQIHLSETRSEVEQIAASHGKSPVDVCAEAGLFERPTVVAHAVHLTEADIDLMARFDVRVAHNPGSNLKLGSGVAPLPKLLQRGVVVGLGTDGAASNNNLDLLEEIRLAALIHKGVGEDPIAVDADTALALGTREGARALFLEEGAGTLAPGAPADLIFMDGSGPHLLPLYNPISQVVYAAKSGDVTDVMCDGRWLLRDRQHQTLDRDKILFHVGRIVEGFTR
ncbi:amidohydrolase [Kyrpidia sp.]|uniref:amidohydrolase n=1 Tax=Kyrpidia sp. TaxID=2073077 RepID=UPI00258C1C29|nr:amidohydrolase [Kyrpidia sp.]